MLESYTDIDEVKGILLGNTYCFLISSQRQKIETVNLLAGAPLENGC